MTAVGTIINILKSLLDKFLSIMIISYCRN
ncbi:alpha family phenol-soluble modulin [uncultured Haemophilus sp.]